MDSCGFSICLFLSLWGTRFPSTPTERTWRMPAWVVLQLLASWVFVKCYPFPSFGSSSLRLVWGSSSSFRMERKGLGKGGNILNTLPKENDSCSTQCWLVTVPPGEVVTASSHFRNSSESRRSHMTHPQTEPFCAVCSLFTSQQQWIVTFLSLSPDWLFTWTSRLPGMASEPGFILLSHESSPVPLYVHKWTGVPQGSCC